VHARASCNLSRWRLILNLPKHGQMPRCPRSTLEARELAVAGMHVEAPIVTPYGEDSLSRNTRAPLFPRRPSCRAGARPAVS
jgi:hypothetical protein